SVPDLEEEAVLALTSLVIISVKVAFDFADFGTDFECFGTDSAYFDLGFAYSSRLHR
nr:hypothetical protein [Tanacetum cinerariifolium]